ncbi:MAG TPA: hypothetical protein VK151_03445 [Fluviicola sp.]|nr:hypothetical protein [Fluviicola sp.]
MKHLILSLFLVFNGYWLAAQDSLFATVHVIYGSKPKAKTEGKWFGGKLGGHVGLEVSPGKVVHFNPGGAVGAWQKNSDTGSYVISTIEGFYSTFGTDSVKQMAVKIPISEAGFKVLDSIANHFVGHPPYPYAFFGMRCAAACYHLLSFTEVYPKISKRKMVRKFFYPRKLRKRLIKTAKKRGWKVTITEGRATRKWDHD